MKTTVILVVILCGSAFAAEDVKMLSYSTFIDYVEQGVVRSVNIYDFGMVQIEAVIEKDGQERTVVVEDPVGMQSDVLLHKFLKENAVDLAILKQEYTGDYEDDYGYGAGGGIMLWSMFSIFLIPGALFVLILVLMIIILVRLQTIHCGIKALAAKE